nr:disease resistance protein (TIR-NBS-LRR class) family [Tanacetum cinerariifolium]
NSSYLGLRKKYHLSVKNDMPPQDKGDGKTTTTRAVNDYLSADSKAKSFIGNVREVSNASMFGLKNLQEQVLSNVLNEQVTLNSFDDRKDMMKRRMFGKKVLLVLDDVDHIEQLKALVGEPKWFKPGSRIPITTRGEQVLVAHRVNLIHDSVLLSEQEAISLFSMYAFGRCWKYKFIKPLHRFNYLCNM